MISKPFDNNSSYKFLLADFDGTLHNSVILVERASNIVLKNHGIAQVEREEIARGMLMPTAERMAFHAKLLGENGTLDKETLPIGNEMAAEFYREFKELLKEGILFDGIIEMIETLSNSNIPLGIVSNNRTDIIPIVLERYGLTSRFEFIIGEDNARETKPLPGGIHQGCEMLGFSPEEGIYLGDSRADSDAARAAGMFSVGVAWNIDAMEDVSTFGFDKTIEHPDDLLALFNVRELVK